MTITVYTKPACVQCHATYKALDKQGLTYQVVDISADDEARRTFMTLLAEYRRYPYLFSACCVLIFTFQNFQRSEKH